MHPMHPVHPVRDGRDGRDRGTKPTGRATGPDEPASSPARARLVVLVSGRGSNLQAIVQACDEGCLAGDVVSVIGNRPQAPALAWAARQGLETVSLDHRGYRSRESFDADLAAAIDSRRPDWIVLAGFMRILGNAFVDRFAGRLVNIHPSLLPLYPGLRTHERALADGALVHGATVHLVTPALDHGPIVAQALLGVEPGDTPASLAARLLPLEHRLYVAALGHLIEGRLSWRDDRLVVSAGQEEDLRGTGRIILDPALLQRSQAVDRAPPIADPASIPAR